MIGALQILLLSLLAAFTVVCGQNWWQTANQPVFVGMVAGLVMGDPVTGLFIGGSMQLTVLGIGTFGGSSHIDANTGSIIATAFSVALGMDSSQALAAIAVPVAAILTVADVLGRFCNTFFQHRIDTLIEREDYAGIQRNFLYGIAPWALSRALPTALALAFGQGLVQAMMDVLNGPLAWLGTGLGVAGAVLPAAGFAILLRYLPVRVSWHYLILGFVVTVFFNYLFNGVKTIGGAVAGVVDGFSGNFIGMPMLGIALVGLYVAVNHYKAQSARPFTENAGSSQEEDDDDEL